MEFITLEPKTKTTHCVIWLHGLGADGYDFEPIVPSLRLPEQHSIRFIFPHAPYRPITLNQNQTMRAWYDLEALDRLDHEDETGILDSCAKLTVLIAAQALPASKILLAGFSQGGAIALYLGLTSPERFAGILALSTYLPFLGKPEKRPVLRHRDLPILQCHGDHDPIVPARLGQATFDYLSQLGTDVHWKQYRMAHAVCPQEIEDIALWMKNCLGMQR